MIRYYYMKRGVYERPGRIGYTQFREFAGTFSQEDAHEEERRSHGEVHIIATTVEEHNSAIKEMINKLEKNLIS